MKKLLFLSTILLATPAPAETVFIRDDYGGEIVRYIIRFSGYTSHQTTVIVDGLCVSACAYVTRVPTACATDRAVFGFHKAFYMWKGKKAYSANITKYSLALYPAHVLKAVNARGGFPKNSILYIKATKLLRECRG